MTRRALWKKKDKVGAAVCLLLTVAGLAATVIGIIKRGSVTSIVHAVVLLAVIFIQSPVIKNRMAIF